MNSFTQAAGMTPPPEVLGGNSLSAPPTVGAAPTQPDRFQALAQQFVGAPVASPPTQDWSGVLRFLDTAQGKKTVRAVIEHAIQMGTQTPGHPIAPGILAMIKEVAKQGNP